MWLVTSDQRPVRRSFAAAIATLVLAALMSLLIPAGSAHATADGYPYAQDQTQTPDDWGFTKRQCVSYAAWRLARAHKPLSNSSQKWGSALNWDNTATRLHITISRAPRVGAIAQWNENEKSTAWASNGAIGTIQAGKYGHVAVVRAIYGDGSVSIEQYNLGGNRAYSTMRVKAPRYLYI